MVIAMPRRVAKPAWRVWRRLSEDELKCETQAPEREFAVLAADDFDGADKQHLAFVLGSTG